MVTCCSYDFKGNLLLESTSFALVLSNAASCVCELQRVGTQKTILAEST